MKFRNVQIRPASLPPRTLKPKAGIVLALTFNGYAAMALQHHSAQSKSNSKNTDNKPHTMSLLDNYCYVRDYSIFCHVGIKYPQKGTVSGYKTTPSAESVGNRTCCLRAGASDIPSTPRPKQIFLSTSGIRRRRSRTLRQAAASPLPLCRFERLLREKVKVRGVLDGNQVKIPTAIAKGCLPHC